jgi:hypothetical protein
MEEGLMSESRSTPQRTSDVRATLDDQRELWLATADRQGRPHMIAASYCWNGERITVTTVAGSRTADNLSTTRLARIAIGSPDDVVMIDASLIDSRSVLESPSQIGDGFAAAVGLDPREIAGDWAFYHLLPSRIQAYRGYDELAGRDVMRSGKWVD